MQRSFYLIAKTRALTRSAVPLLHDRASPIMSRSYIIGVPRGCDFVADPVTGTTSLAHGIPITDLTVLQVALLPSLVTDTDAIHAPAVGATGALFLLPALLDEADAIPAAEHCQHRTGPIARIDRRRLYVQCAGHSRRDTGARHAACAAEAGRVGVGDRGNPDSEASADQNVVRPPRRPRWRSNDPRGHRCRDGEKRRSQRPSQMTRLGL